jgi:hypothetical protein
MIPIAELRRQNASCSAIADLLQQHGVKTSRARGPEYVLIALDGGKQRKPRKRTRTGPSANNPVTSQGAPAVATKPAPYTPSPTIESAANVTPPPKEDSP